MGEKVQGTRLWEKGEGVHKEVHRFTVGNDPIVDLRIVRWEALGLAAHTRMLNKIGILTEKECEMALSSLRQIVELSDAGKFQIPFDYEDCHTAIENFLIEKCGDIGKKVWTGRSRNEVLLATRLYTRSNVIELLEKLLVLVDVFEKRFSELKLIPLPGYTHLQPGMPASVGMWLHAFAENSLELIRDGLLLLKSCDSNPLGVGSGFGVTLPLDRVLTAELLGFSRIQRSPIDVQNSRGRFELKALRWYSDIGMCAEKLSWDMLLYSTREFGFVSLPPELTTGSSIMPQKHNPDVLELLRARSAQLRGAEDELRWLIAKLPSNYHRDFQHTKEPLVRATENVQEIVPVLSEVVRLFRVDEARLKEAMGAELYVTYDVFRRVRGGTPFREAYKQAAAAMKEKGVDKKSLEGDFEMVAKEIESGMVELGKEKQKLATDVLSWKTRVGKTERKLLEH